MSGGAIAAIMAHPDDAEIAMGGTLVRFAEAGRPVHILIACLPDQPERRRAEAAEAGRLLGADVHWFPRDGTWQVEDVKTHEMVAEFDRFLSAVQPAKVFTHWTGDTHYDHVCVGRAVLSAMRRRSAELYAVEQPNLMAPTVVPFPGDTYVDVTGTISRAVEAVRAHASQDETRQFEHPIRARAMYHGHRIGVQYAEVFKSLWRMMDVRP